MELEDYGVILEIRAIGERDAIVSVFGREHGLLKGYARASQSSKLRSAYCVGNWVEVRYRARLEEHLGRLSCEPAISSGAMLMRNRLHCYVLQSLCALVLMGFEQRDPHFPLYRAIEKMIESMRFDLYWEADYARFEALLLREAGFGLGLDRCIATGSAEALTYLSPKSGCAVSREAGAPYRDKLFAYPALLTEEMHKAAHPEAVMDALRITGHFLQKWYLHAAEKPMPQSRDRLMDALEKACLAA